MMQDLVAKMLGNVTACQCLMLRLAAMNDEGKLQDHHAALAKSFCTVRMRETVAWARELFGGNGIVLDYNFASSRMRKLSTRTSGCGPAARASQSSPPGGLGGMGRRSCCIS
jgi:alkylation response protein AidB-like acyl-CoA dehydrogenase